MVTVQGADAVVGVRIRERLKTYGPAATGAANAAARTVAHDALTVEKRHRRTLVASAVHICTKASKIAAVKKTYF
jgi:hypothetical protein